MEKNDEYNINYEYICRYIRRTIKENHGLLRQMEEFAAEHDIPISQPETMRFIEVLVKGAKAEKVLEIGAAIGYSAISMAMCGCHVTTIERDEKMIKLLFENIKKSGLKDRIDVRQGDAAVLLPQTEGCYDLIFLDAAKGQYLDLLPHCLRLLKSTGLLVSDNILYKGMVATDELAVRRKITIIRRLRKYLKELCGRPELSTAIIPIGDGIALSYKN